MINIAMRSQGAIDNSSLSSINTITCDVVQAQTIHSLNTRKQRGTTSSAAQTQHGATSAQSQSAPIPARPQPGSTPAQSQSAPIPAHVS